MHKTLSSQLKIVHKTLSSQLKIVHKTLSSQLKIVHKLKFTTENCALNNNESLIKCQLNFVRIYYFKFEIVYN